MKSFVYDGIILLPYNKSVEYNLGDKDNQTKIIANEVGKAIHEARAFDPHLDDLYAYLVSSQRAVDGVCKVNVRQGFIESVTADSPNNLLAAKGALYGEVSNLYSPQQAEGAARLHGIEQMLCYQMGNPNRR